MHDFAQRSPVNVLCLQHLYVVSNVIRTSEFLRYYLHMSFSMLLREQRLPPVLDVCGADQRWPELLFQTATPILFQNCSIRVRLFFKFENPAPVLTPAAIIDPTVSLTVFVPTKWLYRLLLLPRCKSDSGPGLLFPKFLTPGTDPGHKEKCRILPELTAVIRIRSHLWCGLACLFQSAAASLLHRMTEDPA